MDSWRKSHQDGCPVYYANLDYENCTCLPSYKAEAPPTRKLNGSPSFYGLLKEMQETHDKKSHDYATDSDPYGNYKFAGLVAGHFAHSPDDAGFAGRLAEKMFRLAVLGKRQASPLNESIADTERDIAVIATLWMAMRRDKAIVETSYCDISGAKLGNPVYPTPTVKEQAGYSPENQANQKYDDPLGFQNNAFTQAITLVGLMSHRTRKELFEYLSATLRTPNGEGAFRKS